MTTTATRPRQANDDSNRQAHDNQSLDKLTTTTQMIISPCNDSDDTTNKLTMTKALQ
jgi:hypothetical protein